MTRRLLTAAGLAMLATAISLMPRAARSQAAAYSFTDLGILNAANPYATATSINNSGQVSGWSKCPDSSGTVRQTQFRWDPVTPNGTTGTLRIAALPAGYVHGIGQGGGINSGGQIAGEAQRTTNLKNDPRPANTAFFWDASLQGQPLSLGATAMDTNDAGDVCGVAYSYIDRKTTIPGAAVLWKKINGTYVATTLPGLAGYAKDPGAWSINNAGQVAGKSVTADGASAQSWLWLPTAAYGLPAGTNSLGGIPGHTSNLAWGINDLGQVVGQTRAPSGGRGMLWLPAAAYGLGAGMNDLGTLYATTNALAINNVGQVVGSSGATGGSSVSACLWQNGVWQDLNNLVSLPAGYVLRRANSINDQGQIAGEAAVNGVFRAFLLTPQ